MKLGRLYCGLVAMVLMAGCSPDSTAVRPPSFSATYSQWAIACDQGLAADAGAAMLAAGGNAVDAAVAASFCLSVVRPFSCGIGGGGFMVISLPPSDTNPHGRGVALDYREMCPAAIGPDFYNDLPDDASKRGVRSCGVPGTVAGLLYALEHFGTLDRKTVMAPAIRVAHEGFMADAAFVDAAKVLGEVRSEHPELELDGPWERFAHNGHCAVGDLIVNEPQARSLELIAHQGVNAFYNGPIAASITSVMAVNEGPLIQADLSAYTVRERSALVGDFGSWRVLSMPPPSSGGVATQQIFGFLQRLGGLDDGDDQDSVIWRHKFIEASKHAFADRARWLADDTYQPVPVAALTASAYLDSLAATFNPTGTLAHEAYGSGPQLPSDAGTSHISVLDAGGMAVGCTETINLTWGSCVEVPGFGFMLNDELDDFTTSSGANAFGLIQSDRNCPAPGKRPLSSMNPTIVLADDKPVAIAGASGGPRIISGTVQVLLSMLVFGDDAGAAVVRPRMHHQWQPDELRVEEAWTDQATLAGLRALGHNVVSYPNSVGVVQAIVARDGVISAASDPRKGGRTAGR